MKTYKLVTLIFLLLLFMSSCKKPVENKDFLQSEWKIQSILNENERLSVPSDNKFNKHAYVLKFDKDSSFYLPTSVNDAGGKYQILSEECILIKDYQEWTEIGNIKEHQKEFDKQLLYVLNGVMFYFHVENELIFRGEGNKEIVFVK